MTTSKPRRRGKRIDGDIELAIKERALQELDPVQIFRQMEALPEFQGRVNLRTIERRCAELRPLDPSGSWDWRQSGVDDIRGILDVLGVVVERTEGRKTTFTKREAALVDMVLKTAPGLHPWVVYLLVRWVLRAEAEGTHIEEIDYLLMFRAWESPRQLERYKAAVADLSKLDLLTADYILGMHKMLTEEEQS